MRTRTFEGRLFISAERLDSYQDAVVAQAEYHGSGYCCRKVPVQPARGRGYYEIWLGPERKVAIKTLAHEDVRRYGADRWARKREELER